MKGKNLESKSDEMDFDSARDIQHCANGTNTGKTKPIGHQRGGTYQAVRVVRSNECAS
jgi:hypothetical protein